uniref:Translation initiation factor 6 n=1 Tax=Geoglobus ahangari TaxID=113653 RepID=A0A7C3UJG1_9EURY
MKLLSIHGSPLIGLYIRASENFAIIGIRDKIVENIIREELDVDVIMTTICGSELVGAMIALNDRGAIVSKNILKRELNKLSKYMDILVLDTEITCFGNILALNNRGAIIHPEIENKIIDEIEKFLGIEVRRGTVGGIKTVGMASVITNRGAIVNPNANDWELKIIGEVLKVEPVKGTVNFGNEMVGTGVVANSKGYLAGKDTTGFELGLIEEALFG